MYQSSKSISDETLLGYLLSALPDEETLRIDQLASQDAELRSRIADMRSLLIPIEQTSEPFEARGDLVRDTMDLIQTQSEELGLVPKSKTNKQQPAPYETCAATRIAWLDSMAVLAAGVLVLSVLLPSVWYARESARRISCASNMRELGVALTNFTKLNASRSLPRIEPDGPLSFAGVYSIRLKDSGLLPVTRWLWCPSMQADDWDPMIPESNVYLTGTSTQQKSWRLTSGGTYAFNLGSIVDGRYETPKLDGSSMFAVMGDTLISFDDNETSESAHGINVANVLYSDGRVLLIRLNFDEAESAIDYPYLNRNKERAAGTGPNDCCLGPSFQNPLMPIWRGKE